MSAETNTGLSRKGNIMLEKDEERGRNWRLRFVDQKATYRCIRRNGNAIDGLIDEVTWPNGLVVQIGYDRIDPNDWTMVSRCNQRAEPSAEVGRYPWGNLVNEGTTCSSAGTSRRCRDDVVNPKQADPA